MEIENLNPKEHEMIEKLRMLMKNALSPEMYEDDLLFYRFLKARDFDINKAELMLKKHIAFRKAMRIETLLQDFQPKEVFTKYIQGSYLGHDKKGFVVRYMAAGKVDAREAVSCFKYSGYYKHVIWLVESDLARLEEAGVKTGRNSKKFTFIIDLDELQLSTVCYPESAAYGTRFAKEYQDNYPETLNLLFVINAPKYFVILYSILKTVLAPEVIRKIHVFGTSGWKEELLKIIDADTLPAFLGGNRTDPDGNPRCNTFICHGGRIPSKYYLSKEDFTFKDKSQVKYVTIHPRERHEVCFEVNECGSVIQWEFQVKNRDIGFGLYLKKSVDELREILPVYRFETLAGTHDDSYKCLWTGIYVIFFDNTYSWFHSKKIAYCVTVVNPGQ